MAGYVGLPEMLAKRVFGEIMDLEFYNEASLLRCSKDELIEYIFKLRKDVDARMKEDGQMWDLISSMKRIPKIRDIWENCD